MKSIMEIVDFRHCVQERDECGQRGMGKYISACKIQSGRSNTRFPPFLQSILALALNGGGRQGIFLCPYHLPFYVVKYKYVIIFSMEWL